VEQRGKKKEKEQTREEKPIKRQSLGQLQRGGQSQQKKDRVKRSTRYGPTGNKKKKREREKKSTISSDKVHQQERVTLRFLSPKQYRKKKGV